MAYADTVDEITYYSPISIADYVFTAKVKAGDVYKFNNAKYVSTGGTLSLAKKNPGAYSSFASSNGKHTSVYEFRKIIVVSGQTKQSNASYFLAAKPGAEKPKFYKFEGSEDTGVMGVNLKTNEANRGKGHVNRVASIPKFVAETHRKNKKRLDAREKFIRKNKTPSTAVADELDKTGGRSGRPSKKKNKDKKKRPIGTGPLPPVPPVTRVLLPTVDRALGSIVTPESGKPYFLQRYTILSEDPTGQTEGQWVNIDRRFALDIVPNSIDFTQMASTWSEIDRTGDYSLVDWSRHNLLKVSFRFLVAAKNVAELVGSADTYNGLQISIDSQLEVLRALAGAQVPVQLINFTDYMSNTYRFPFLSKKEGIYFVIAEMTVNATRFVNDGTSTYDRNGSLRSIAAAEVTVTLTEYPKKDNTPLFALPPLVLQSDKPTTTKKPQGNKPGYTLFTPSLKDGYIYIPTRR